MGRIRKRVGLYLRVLADRIDPDDAFEGMSPFTYTFEPYLGLVLREDGRGCPLWHRAHERVRAHTEAGGLTYSCSNGHIHRRGEPCPTTLAMRRNGD